MTPTFLTMVAIFMAALALAMAIATHKYLRTKSSVRLRRMMARVGLAPGIGRRGDPRTDAIMKQVHFRCRKCPSQALCEMWLAGEVGGSNAFCPNAQTFKTMAGPVVPTLR